MDWYQNMKVDWGQNVRLIVSLWHFIISAPTHLFVSLSRRLVCSIRRLASSTRRFYEFDSSPTTPVCHPLSFHRFIMPFRRFGSITQRGYNLTCFSWIVTWFHALIHDASLHSSLSADWRWVIWRATYATALNSSWIKWMSVFMLVKMELDI